MKKDRDYITAGAYYRLVKDLIADACTKISSSLKLTKTEREKLFDVQNKFAKLETSIGFENKAFDDEFDGEIRDLFYGYVGAKRYTDTDRDVELKIKEILQDYIDRADVSLNDNDM